MDAHMPTAFEVAGFVDRAGARGFFSNSKASAALPGLDTKDGARYAATWSGGKRSRGWLADDTTELGRESRGAPLAVVGRSNMGAATGITDAPETDTKETRLRRGADAAAVRMALMQPAAAES